MRPICAGRISGCAGVKIRQQIALCRVGRGRGMKGVELYGRVRHAVRIEGLSERAAARRFGIDPRTVAKMMAFSVPPGYRRKKPPARPKLDPFIAIIDRILAEDKSRPKKQRHTAKRIFERLRDEHGFAGGITIVKDYVRELAAAGAGDVRAAGASAGACPGRLRRSDRRRSAGWSGRSTSSRLTCRTATPASCRPIRRRRRRPSAPATSRRSPSSAACRSRSSTTTPRCGGPHPGRRQAAADAGVQRAAVALPVRGSVRPTRQGQRQGQSRGAGRLCAAELPGADPGVRRASRR